MKVIKLRDVIVLLSLNFDALLADEKVKWVSSDSKLELYVKFNTSINQLIH